MFVVESDERSRIPIGRLGENRARVIKFPIGDILDEFPDATFGFTNKRHGDIDSYPVSNEYIRVEDRYLWWTVMSGDLAKEGSGECQIIAMEGEAIVKTHKYLTVVGPALDGNSNPPEPWESWTVMIIQAADSVTTAYDAWVNMSARAETLMPDMPAYARYENGVLYVGVPRGPAGEEIIDDTAGTGITDRAWSADKLVGAFAEKLDANLKGAPNGVAELDAGGKVPSSQLPAYVDDVVNGYLFEGKFYEDAAHTAEIPGESGKIYVDLPSNTTYRWSGVEFVQIKGDLVLGETSSNAYRGDRGKAAYDHATAKGAAFASGMYKVTTNAEGHVTDATPVVKSDITALGIPGDISGKADKADTVLDTTLSHGRKANTTVGLDSIAYGYNVEASGQRSFAFGQGTVASSSRAFAEGYETTASGTNSHAENNATTASGLCSHAEGNLTTASGEYSHSEGYETEASGIVSHAEGFSSTASGYGSHAEGYKNTASGIYSHAEGYLNTANHAYQHTFGTYNVPDPSSAAATAKGTYIEIVGNGTANMSSARSNARTLDWNGNERLKGDLYVGCDSDGSGGTKVSTVDDIVAESEPLWESLLSVADINLWNMAKIKEGYSVGNNGDLEESTRFDCTETIIPVEPGTYKFTATSTATPDGYAQIVRVYSYLEDKTYRWNSVSESFPASGGDISFTFTVYSVERWIRLSYVPSLSNVVLSKATGVTAIDRVARESIPDVSGFYTKPQTGIPASDLADGVIPDISGKADKTDTVFTSTLSRGRKAETTIGEGSFAFGNGVTASGAYSHAEGNGTTASGASSHAEGNNTNATANGSHAEGSTTRASGNYAHAEGSNTTASGNYTHAEGAYTKATGRTSHAEGTYTEAKNLSQHVSGEYNVVDPSGNPATDRGTYAEIIGNGTADNSRSNARALDWNGNERLMGDLYVGCNADSTGGMKVAKETAVETLSGTTVTITGVDNHRYICGELATLSITAPQSGIIDVVFESGTTPTVLTVTGITFPEWFDPTTDIEADTTYEINVLDGRGVVSSWN